MAALAADDQGRHVDARQDVAPVLDAARGIRCNAVLPGLIDTPLVAQQVVADPAAEAARRDRDAASPTGRSGSPWDVAHAAVFLASDEAAYVNGVCLPVDGGLVARAL